MIAFITGATSGFGQSTAELFVKKGHKVIATGRRGDRLEKLAKKFNKKLITYELDVNDPIKIAEVIDGLPKDFSHIDVLINNAGLALGMDSAVKAKMSDWNQMVDTNIKGVLNCTHAILPGMVERNRGHIINLGSVAGEFPYPSGNVYGATKAFVHQFSLSLRADLLGTNIRVTCVEPGICSGTEFSEVRYKGDIDKAKAVYKGVEALTPDDIAESIYWIATRPAHVNINIISMMPVQQAFGAFAVDRSRK